MGNIVLDKNYNLVEERAPYESPLVDAVDLISKAESEKIISKSEASFLLKLVLRREVVRETKAILPLSKQPIETHSLFLNMKSKQIKHA